MLKKFNNGLHTYFFQLCGQKNSRNSSRLIDLNCKETIRLRTFRLQVQFPQLDSAERTEHVVRGPGGRVRVAQHPVALERDVQ